MDIKDFSDKYKSYAQVDISEQIKGTIIYFFTEHSVYTLEVIDPAECKVIASGGYFKLREKEPCETYIIGSTLGGSMIYKKKLIEGLFCEFHENVITSRINKIFINNPN